MMSLAKRTLDSLSHDPKVRRLAREREDAIKLHRMELVASRDHGMAEIVLEQLTARFGPLAESTQARVEAGTTAQLLEWARRVLTASTLDEVFAG